jgi:O-antigen ligase
MMVGFALSAIASAIPLGTAGDVAQEVGKLVALVVLILNLVRTPERYRALVTALLIFTAYLACYSAYLYFTGQALKVHDIQRSQTTGIFGDPNDLAATIASGLALALSRVATTRKWPRLFHLGLSGLYIFAILLTNSRGGMLSLLIVAGGFFWVYVKHKSAALLLAAIAMSVAFVAAPSRMRTFDRTEESANTRFWFWHAGIEQFKMTPVLGSGFGTFPSINGGMTAHNSFVLCFTELGLVGYFFWMGCIYYCFRPSPAPPDEGSPPGALKEDLLGAKLALAAFLVAGFFLSRTYVPILYVFLSLPIAAQVAYSVDLDPFKQLASRRARDYAWIFSLCIMSIALTKFMVDRLR